MRAFYAVHGPDGWLTQENPPKWCSPFSAILFATPPEDLAQALNAQVFTVVKAVRV